MATKNLSIFLTRTQVSSISLGSIFIIVLVHVLGFLSIQQWMEFSGIGQEATRLEQVYGMIAVYLLNLLAVLLFLGIFFFLRYSFATLKGKMMGKAVAFIFVIRGIIGFVAIIIGATGTATNFWEAIFSIWALLTGVFIFITYGRME